MNKPVLYCWLQKQSWDTGWLTKMVSFTSCPWSTEQSSVMVVSCYYHYRTTNLFLRGWQIFPQWAGGEGDNRGWDGWMASLTQWTWVWVNSGSWWWTGRPGVLQFMGSQRVRHDWATELNWTEASINPKEWYKASVIVMKGHLDKC